MSVVLLLRRHDRLGLVLWTLGFAVTMVLFALNPDTRSVVPSYRFGSENFLAHLPIYNLERMGGYLYTPAFAVLFAPFLLLGPLAGEAVWRILGFAVLTYAAMRQARLVEPANWLFILSMGLVIALPISLGAFRNGQSTILLAGACWLATMAALERKPWQTLLWATVALVAKPVAIVVLLLLGAIRLRMVPVLLLSVMIVLVLPYGFAPTAYVNDLYRTFATLMIGMSVERSAYFVPADFTAPFTAVGLDVPGAVATAIRFVFAMATLGAVLWLDRSCKGRFTGLAIFVVAAFYISVFNPRVESNTYAFVGAPFGLTIAYMLLHATRTALAWILCGLLVAAGLTGISPSAWGGIHVWLRPMICVVIFAGMAWSFRDWLLSRVRQGERSPAVAAPAPMSGVVTGHHDRHGA